MSGDLELQGHTLSPIFGFPGERYAICSCEERFDGRSPAEVEDFHRQHCERIHDALAAPQRREIARRGLERAWDALAEALDRKERSA